MRIFGREKLPIDLPGLSLGFHLQVFLEPVA
jgi:hypothetical protein